METYRSFRRLNGNLEPGGKRGFSLGGSFEGCEVGRGEGLEEFPALPDFTIPRPGPLRGGI